MRDREPVDRDAERLRLRRERARARWGAGARTAGAVFAGALFLVLAVRWLGSGRGVEQVRPDLSARFADIAPFDEARAFDDEIVATLRPGWIGDPDVICARLLARAGDDPTLPRSVTVFDPEGVSVAECRK
jgi:hypothetical protein